MTKININRLRVVLAEQSRTNRWLAEKLEVNENTVSQWVTNNKQPSLETLYKVAMVLKVDIRELLESTLAKK
jgi:putative transcriptional regulator